MYIVYGRGLNKVLDGMNSPVFFMRVRREAMEGVANRVRSQSSTSQKTYRLQGCQNLLQPIVKRKHPIKGYKRWLENDDLVMNPQVYISGVEYTHVCLCQEGILYFRKLLEDHIPSENVRQHIYDISSFVLFLTSRHFISFPECGFFVV